MYTFIYKCVQHDGPVDATLLSTVDTWEQQTLLLRTPAYIFIPASNHFPHGRRRGRRRPALCLALGNLSITTWGCRFSCRTLSPQDLSTPVH